MKFRNVVSLFALVPALATGCASGAPCFCALFPESVVAEAEPAPPEPIAARVVPPPVAAPPPPRKIVLRGVNFDFDKAELREDDKAVLDAAIESLKENESARVKIAGFTDNIGTEEHNQGLSERRASSVLEYLLNGGVEANRLDSVGEGMSNPVADNATRDGRAQNRRVELNVQQ
jgi:outer membrane protein OmpA-like peptidoglycan-associated protein